MSNEIVRHEQLPATISFEQMREVAKSIAESKLFGVKTEQEALALMLLAQSENLHYAAAVRDYNIVQGKPALKADAMLARFQASGGKVEWKEYSDARVTGIFSHPSSPTPITVDWDLERARRAGISTKQGPWQQYPRAMLRARCISEGVRTCFPGVSLGVYTPEEVVEFAQAKPLQVKESDTFRPAPAPDTGKLLSESIVEGFVNAMNDAESLEVLQQAFRDADKAAREARDSDARKRFTIAKDMAKQRIETDEWAKEGVAAEAKDNSASGASVDF